MNTIRTKWPKLYQIAKYGVIGVLATVVHNLIYHCAMEAKIMNSTLNNLLAYVFSIQTSYWGHRLVTFNNPEGITTKRSISKYLTAAAGSVCISSIVSLVLIDSLHYSHYWLIAFNVTCLPIFSFLILKFWVFKH